MRLAMLRRFAGSLLEALVVLALLSTVVFLALRLLPGDPSALILGDHATAAERAELRHRLHLDEPMYVQYARFMKGLFSLSHGDSLRRPGVPAMARVGSAFWPTATLALLGTAMGALLGVTLSVLAVGPWLPKGRRRIVRFVDVLAATPLLAFAPALTYVLAVWARIVPLPGDPQSAFGGTLFASALLAIPLAAHVSRTTTAALTAILSSQYLSVARAKGASFVRTWVVHGLRSTTAPILTVVGSQLGALLGGAVVLERLFERPGLGSLMLEAYASRDLPVLEAAVFASGALFVATQIATTAAQTMLDPRARS
ncbi:MAG: ABC transporter permease [Polyangiaceae bacterium]